MQAQAAYGRKKGEVRIEGALFGEGRGPGGRGRGWALKNSGLGVRPKLRKPGGKDGAARTSGRGGCGTGRASKEIQEGGQVAGTATRDGGQAQQ